MDVGEEAIAVDTEEGSAEVRVATLHTAVAVEGEYDLLSSYGILSDFVKGDEDEASKPA